MSVISEGDGQPYIQHVTELQNRLDGGSERSSSDSEAEYELAYARGGPDDYWDTTFGWTPWPVQAIPALPQLALAEAQASSPVPWLSGQSPGPQGPESDRQQDLYDQQLAQLDTSSEQGIHQGSVGCVRHAPPPSLSLADSVSSYTAISHELHPLPALMGHDVAGMVRFLDREERMEGSRGWRREPDESEGEATYSVRSVSSRGLRRFRSRAGEVGRGLVFMVPQAYREAFDAHDTQRVGLLDLAETLRALQHLGFCLSKAYRRVELSEPYADEFAIRGGLSLQEFASIASRCAEQAGPALIEESCWGKCLRACMRRPIDLDVPPRARLFQELSWRSSGW